MTEEPHTLIIDILRRLQTDMAELKNGQRDIKAEIISVKKQLHAMQGDNLRQEGTIAGIQLDVDRIKTRLDLTNA